MASYPSTGSTLNGSQGNGNKTSTGVSTSIIIKVGPNTVGAIQELSVSESRNIKMIQEIGTDGNIDSVPNSATEITGSCKRIRFDRMRIAESLGRGFLHAKSQRVGFNIEIIDTWNGDGSASLITTLTNVWISKIDFSFSSQDWVIADTMQWKAEDISTHFPNGSPGATGGERNLQLAIDPIEQLTDIGGRRGSLDAGGLLKSFLPY